MKLALAAAGYCPTVFPFFLATHRLTLGAFPFSGRKEQQKNN